MKNITLSIIIVNYNTGNLLRECLKSIVQTCDDIKYEIFVVDNNSFDNSWQAANEFPNCKLIKNKSNVGFCVANNQALKKNQSDFILLLNPDTKLTEGAIEKMIEYLQDNLKIGIMGPKVLYPNGKLQYTVFQFPTVFDIITGYLFLNKLFPKSRIFNRKNLGYWDHSEIKEVDAVSGCCLLLRRKIYEDIGGLDENLFFIDDLDFCKRAKNQGWKVVYFPKAIIYHYGAASPKRTRYAPAYFGRIGKILYFKKHHSSLAYFFVIGITFAESVLRIPLDSIFYLLKRNEASRTRLRAYINVILFILKKTHLV